MPARLATLALLVVVFSAWRGALAQGPDLAMQNLLAGLTRGSEVVLYTPLGYGLVEVTRFTPPVPLPRAEAEAAVVVAREQLRMLDIPVPTASQLARALVGGSIETRDGPQHLPGVLPLTGERPLVTTEILVAGAPQVPAPASAASGGSASHPAPR
ncbi:MAG TPA: hypothetical protein VF211_04240 [Burkholderiales bacterium]